MLKFSGPFLVRAVGKSSDRIALRVHTFEALKVDREGDWRFMAEPATGGFNPSAAAKKRKGKSNNDILGVLFATRSRKLPSPCTIDLMK